jgi:hypothetical protein
MSGPLRSRLNRRVIARFSAVGAVGPLLIPLLRTLFGTGLYDPLYLLILVLCPAWLLGPLEYSYGAVATWIAILIANVAIWSAVGLVAALTAPVWIAAVLGAILLGMIGAYGFWISGSFPATVVLLMLVSALYVFGRRVRGSHA